MAKKRAAAKGQDKVSDFLRTGGIRIPPGLASDATEATSARLRERFNAGSAARKQGAKLLGGLKGASSVSLRDPANKKTLDALLAWHKKRAAKKLAFPKVPGDIGGIFPGSFSGTIVPPFDFADTIPTLLAGTSNPTLSASASRNGQIRGSVVSSQTRGFNGGSEFARVGIFFHPMTAGTLTISASPTYSFQWSTNSLNTSLVTSFGSVGLTIFGMNEFQQILAGTNGLYELWDEEDTGEINFNFGFDVQKSLSISLDVTPSLMYLCFVEVDTHVVGMGWPGSLATSMASATVPSIRYGFSALPVLTA